MSEQANEEKKIIVDEDWKEQAQREKEALHEAFDKHKRSQYPLLQADFSILVSSMTTQALISLGEMENPLTKKQEFNLEEAKFHIDMLHVLEEKTKGNLTDEEAKLLKNILFDLRMRFVNATKKVPDQDKPNIEIPT